MRVLRQVNNYSEPEEWGEDDVMSFLGCDKNEAERIMKECRKKYGISGYGDIEKALILDYIEEKQRTEREREARHQSDIANTRIATSLEEQVKTLHKQVDVLTSMSNASSEDARKARMQSRVAYIISFASMVIALVAMILKLL